MPATKKYEDKSPRSLKQKIYDENRPKSSTAIEDIQIYKEMTLSNSRATVYNGL